MKKRIIKTILFILLFQIIIFSNNSTLYSKSLYEKDNLESKIEYLSSVEEETINSINNEENIVYISGILQWKDDHNNLYPLRNTFVEICNKESSNLEYIRSGYTNDDGYISFELNNLENYDIVIKIYTRGYKINVYDNGNNNYIHNILIMSIDNAILGSTYDCSVIIDMTTDEGKAFQVFQALLYGYDYSKEMGTDNISSVDVVYPSSTDGCIYNRTEERIYIPSKHYKFWDELLHELGHHFQNEFDLCERVGGEHLFDTNLVDIYGLDKGRKLAWAEAWPNVFAIQVTQYYKDKLSTVEYATDEKYQLYNKGNSGEGYKEFNLESDALKNNLYGEGFDSVLFSLLYDIYDLTQDLYDNINLGHENFWDLIINSNSKSFFEFSEYCYNSSLINNFDFYNLLYGYGISPINVELVENEISKYYVPTVTWNTGGPSKSIVNNLFVIKFYDEDKNEILTVERDVSYNSETGKEEVMLTDEEWSILLSTLDEKIYVSVGGKISSDIDAVYYYSQLIEVIMPTPFNLTMDNTINKVVNANNFIWCKFTAPKTGNYEFYTNSNIDTFIEIFNNPVSSIVTDNRLKYDDNSAENNNAKVKIGLIENETIYIRVQNLHNNNAGVQVGVNSSTEENEFIINCRNYVSKSGISYNEYEFLIHKLQINCPKSYTFIISSDLEVELKLYNENMDLITDEFNVLENNMSYSIVQYLNIGTYYIQANFKDRSLIGYLSAEYYATYNNPYYEIYYYDNCGTNDILTHLHKNENGIYENKLYYINNLGTGFFNIIVNAILLDGTSISLPGNSIIVKDNDRETVIDKYSYLNYSNQAINIDNQNEMVVYLSRNGYFYIDINLVSGDFLSLTLSIERVDEEKLDLFELNPYTNDELINETYLYKDYFRKIVLDMPIQANFKITYNGILNDDILVLVTKMVYDEEENTYVLSNVYCGYINSINVEHNLIFNLDDGMYYIGYFNNNSNEEIDILLERNLTLSGGEYLITDPDSMTECGSHINIYEKYTTTSITTPSYKGTNITEGFTRLIYLTDDNLPSRSRLDYYWYSSDESVATISSYGTILGLSVSQNTNVKIMAIYKEDPSIAFVKEFIILNDNEGYYIALDIYAEHNISEGSYKIELTSKNSPYPSIQCYEWNVVDTGFENIDTIININTYGYVDINQIGTYEIIGEYKYNNRFHIHYHLSVI